MGLVTELARHWVRSASFLILDGVLPPTPSVARARVDAVLNSGHRSKLLVTRGESKFVCQFALRRGYCEALGAMHELARADGVPLAPVLAAGIYSKPVVRMHYIVLDWMPGSPCTADVRLSLSQLTELGAIFGRLNSIDASRWMHPDVDYPTRFADFETMHDTWESMMRELRELDPEVSEQDLATASTWLRNQSAFLRSISRFGLMHGDVHGGNVVLDRGRLSLIDTDQMRFGFAPFELFRCLMANYNDFDQQRQTAFLKGYQRVVEPVWWRLWEEHVPFIAGVFFLETARQKLIESKALRHEGRSAVRFGYALTFWKAFLDMTKMPSSRAATLPDVMRIYYEARRQTDLDLELAA